MIKKQNKVINPNDDELFQSEVRDKKYTQLVDEIIKDNRSTQVYKSIFFAIVCLILVAVSVCGIVSIVIIAGKEDISWADFGVAISGLGGVLSSIIALPQIIAKHLFPENSEQVRYNFIEKNQQFDLEQSTIYTDDTGDNDETGDKNTQDQNGSIGNLDDAID